MSEQTRAEKCRQRGTSGEKSDQTRAFDEAVDYLYRIPKFTKKHSLSHTKELMRLLGNPAGGCKVIHVAGSNGKGSVCSFLSSVLQEGGKRTGLFTSPHLVDIRERFRINGELCGKELFLESFAQVREAVRRLEEEGLEHPTFFEYLFAMGMVIFEAEQAEYLVLETGLGGRLDATNIVERPLMTVITSISLEHTQYLGDTVSQIAAEKAGILKPGVPVVYDSSDACAAAVIADRARELGCPACAVGRGMYRILEFKNHFIDFSLSTAYDKDTNWEIPFAAAYQVQNAALAITALRVMQERHPGELPGEDALRRGIRGTSWPGRMQEAAPGVWVDGAHNPAGIRAFAETARRMTREDACAPLLLFSMVRDKDYTASIRLLADAADWDRIAVTEVPDERGLPFEELKGLFEKHTGRPVRGYADYREALADLIRGRREGQKLFCTGSLYFAGALLRELKGAEALNTCRVQRQAGEVAARAARRGGAGSVRGCEKT